MFEYRYRLSEKPMSVQAVQARLNIRQFEGVKVNQTPAHCRSPIIADEDRLPRHQQNPNRLMSPPTL